MFGDFARVTFNRRKHRSRVLHQQGRVQLEADWNEQMEILLHLQRTFIRDLVGMSAGPLDHCGFDVMFAEQIKTMKAEQEKRDALIQALGRNKPGNFFLSPGSFYVNGILVEIEDYTLFTEQPHRTSASPDLDEALESANTPHLVYLDVWERSVQAVEDDSLLEVALGGLDTCARTRVVWAARLVKLDAGDPQLSLTTLKPKWEDLERGFQGQHPRGRLKVRAKAAGDSEPAEPCLTPPSSSYRGLENQLYRIEIHSKGTAKSGATFKFSRVNGSAVYKVRGPSGGRLLSLDTVVGRDGRFALNVGDWVEVVDEAALALDRAGQMLKVDKVFAADNRIEVTLAGSAANEFTIPRTAYLRRWDHKAGDPKRGGLKPSSDGAAFIEEGSGSSSWLALEDGIEIQFQPGPTDHPHEYRTGDYWLVPARTATGDVEWPGSPGHPDAVGPHGVKHWYAPLRVVKFNDQRDRAAADCRKKFSGEIIFAAGSTPA